LIPNSHLDREWTLEYQQTRRLTVEFLDRLLQIFDEVPEYRFTLDSQTVPLEDYLEIRPENEERIRQAVKGGKLAIGPWYTAPDDNMLSGESIVRNLLAGDRVARRFGRPMKAGYTPFGFGQVSQLPQIYAGFGIDIIFFYRGIQPEDTPSAEFQWEAPDGTRALCSRFGTKARYNFFMDVWRPVAYGRDAKERIFSWRTDTVPFKRITADREYDHFFVLEPKKELHRDELERSFRTLIQREREHFTTPAIAMMQGMDTTKPDPLEAEIVEELKHLLEPGEELFFSNMELYAKDLRRLLDKKKLKTFHGEMRRTGPPSPFTTTLENIYSGRVRQKIGHSQAETALVRRAEPFAALSWATGAQKAYPKTYLDLAWRYLLRCQPHDTVAGCGVDKIERDATYRLDQVKAISDLVLDDALGSLVLRIDNSSVKEDEIVLTVFNPLPRRRTEVVDAYIDMAQGIDVIEYEVVEAESGKRADFAFVYRKPCEKTVRDNTDLTNALVGWSCRTQIVAEDVPPMGWKTYIVRRSEPLGRKERLAPSPARLENEFLRADFRADGTLDLMEKESGAVYTGLHSLLDEGENGNGWEWRAPSEDRVITSAGAPARLELVENSALLATIRVTFRMSIPSGIEHDDGHHYARRSEHEEEMVVSSDFTLRKGARRLDVRTVIDNRSKNHRLRVCFPTELSKAKTSSAETPYDVVERAIDRDQDHGYAMAPNPNYPCRRFVDVSDGKQGLAVITEGLHEYEVTDDPSRTIRMTLLRAYEVTLCTVSYRWERRPDQELAQVPGKVAARYALYPHGGDWESGGVIREADEFELPLLCGQSGRNTNGSWPRTAGLAVVAPQTVILSAIKRAEDRETLVLRLFNTSGESQKAVVEFPQKVKAASPLNMNEEPMKDSSLKKSARRVETMIRGRGVYTLEVELEQGEIAAARTFASSAARRKKK